MLKVYFDESGQESGGEVCVVAGFMGTKTRWQAFDSEWHDALGQRKSLHMRELRWGDKNASRNERLLAKLGPIPHRHGLMPVVGIVKHADYRAVVLPYSSHRVFDPWPLAVQMCIVTILGWLPAGETLAPIFEEQGAYGPDLITLYDIIYPHGDDRLVRPEFVRKGTTHATEAADYLASQYRQKYLDENSARYKMGVSIIGDASITALPRIYGVEGLRTLVDQLARSAAESRPMS